MEIRTVIFGLLVAVLAALGFLIVAPFLQYVLAAALLAFLFHPVHRRLEQHVGPRLSAGILTTVAILVAIVPILVLSVVILGSIISFIDDLEQSDIDAVFQTLQDIATEYFAVDPTVFDHADSFVRDELETLLHASMERLLQEMVALIDTTIHMAFGFMLLIFLLYYFIRDGTTFITWLAEVSPLEADEQEELFEEIKVVTWAVIYSHLLVAIVEGILGGIGFIIVGISNVAFWTVVMVVVSILPVIGVWLVWGPAVVYLLLTGDVFGAAFLLLYGIAVLSVVDNYLRALFVDKGSGLHPAVVLIGVIGGIYFLGVLGLFLGPIILAVLKASITVFSRSYRVESA